MEWSDMAALIIVQARMGSSRFPGKPLAKLKGRPILWYLFHQLSFCRNEVTPILATTDRQRDDRLAGWGWKNRIKVFRGSEDDVLGRYRDAARAFGAEDETPVVRVAGDDIFTDPRLIDAALDLLASFKGRIDCVFTPVDETLPASVYVESYLFSALARAHVEATDPSDREHVTPYIRRNIEKFPRIEIQGAPPCPGIQISIDHPEDLELNKKVLDRLQSFATPPYSVADLLKATEGIEGKKGDIISI